MMLRPLIVATAFFVLASSLSLADAERDLAGSWPHRPALRVPAMGEAPSIDGRVGEREWTDAAKLPPLIRWSDGRMDTERTEVFIGHTGESIVLAWRLHRDWDGPMHIGSTTPGRHEGRSVWLDDAVEIFFDLEGEGQRAVSFAGNAAGAFGDGMGRKGSSTNFDESWDWDYAARETEAGWEGELSITFGELGLGQRPSADRTIGFDFWRNNKTPDGAIASYAYGARWGAELAFDPQVPAFRPLQTGSVGDRAVGMLAELINGTDSARSVSVDLGIYRRKDDSAELDFIDEVHSGLEQAGQDVAAFTSAGDQIEQLLGSFYEPVAERTQRVGVAPGSRRPLNLTAEGVGAGDYVIAYRASHEGEVLSAGLIPARRSEPIEVAVVPYFLSGEQLDVAVTFHSQQLRDEVERVSLTLKQHGRALATRTGSVEEAADGVALPSDEIEPGSYELNVEGVGADGQIVVELSESQYRPQPPFWVTGEHGTRAFVPEPWTPVEAAPEAVHIWGRAYEFGNGFLPVQVRSQGEPMFAAPPRLVMQVDGQDVAIEGRIELTGTSPEHADYRWVGSAGPVAVEADVRVEFDGFTTIDLAMDTEGVTVDRLFVEFPLAERHAELYTLNAFYNEQRGFNVERLSGGLDRSGRINDGFEIGFNHAIWLGTPERGVQWCAETAEHWHNERSSRAIEVLPGHEPDRTLLRLRVIDRPTQADRLTYRWGMVASPTRPGPRTEQDELYYLQVNYPAAWPNEDGVARFEQSIEKAQRLGADWINIFSQWNRDFAFGQPIREGDGVEERRQMVDRIHEAGIKTTWYTGWNGLTPGMEMYPYYGEAMRRVPSRFTYGGYKECTYGGYEQYLANGTVWMVENLGVDGIYLDSTPGPEPCLNPYHGCGFVSPDTGNRVVTRDIWGRRALFLRLYKIFHGEVVDEGLIYGHDGRPPLLAVTSFVDVFHTGESASMTDYENLDFYLAQYNPTQYGTPVEHAWRAHHPVPRNFAWGVALVHDNGIKMYPPFARQPSLQSNSYEPEQGIDWRMWVPQKWFDWSVDHTWHPYYSNEDVLSVSGDRIYASFHHNVRNQIILNVLNTAPDDQHVQFELDIAALELPNTLHARDVVTHETFDIREGRFSLDVLGHRPRVLMIDATEVPQVGPGVDD